MLRSKFLSFNVRKSDHSGGSEVSKHLIYPPDLGDSPEFWAKSLTTSRGRNALMKMIETKLKSVFMVKAFIQYAKPPVS